MKLIVGLGNPGTNYHYTRHNLGFLFLDYLQEKQGFSDFHYESKFTSEVASGTFLWEKTLLIKPQTFMNLSGEALQKITNFYKISSDDRIVIYDDLSLEFGKIRFREKWSAWWHNGIKNIIQHLWDNFSRIKCGIGLNEKYEVSDRVLSKFSEEEQIDLDTEVFPQSFKILQEKFYH